MTIIQLGEFGSSPKIRKNLKKFRKQSMVFS